MLSKTLSQQFERALLLLEAQQSLEVERRESQAQRHADLLAAVRAEAQQSGEHVRLALLPVIMQRTLDLQEEVERTHSGLEDLLVRLSQKLDQLHEQAAIPKGDIPTVEELLDKARTDAGMKKTLQNTLAELEFADPLIEIN